MPDRLDKCYYWHIITLALMKNNLRILGGKRKIQKPKVKEPNSYTDQSI